MLKKILIVEDEKQMQQMVSMRLKAAGYEVITADDGRQAMEQVVQYVPDLVITDVLMPVMDGFSLYKELKKGAATKDIPVLILTARGQMEDTFKVVGADDFIAKPFEAEELLSKVEELTQVSRKTSVAPETQKKVLIAGNHKDMINKIILLLKKENQETVFAFDGSDAVQKVIKFNPDIIVLDVLLDSIPTEEAIKIIRKMTQYEKTPIIVYNFYKTEDLGSTSVREKILLIDSAQEACKEAGITEDIGRINEYTFIEKMKKYFSK